MTKSYKELQQEAKSSNELEIATRNAQDFMVCESNTQSQCSSLEKDSVRLKIVRDKNVRASRDKIISRWYMQEVYSLYNTIQKLEERKENKKKRCVELVNFKHSFPRSGCKV